MKKTGTQSYKKLKIMKFNFFNSDFSNELSTALAQFTSTMSKLEALNSKIDADKKVKIEQIETLKQEVKSHDQLMRKSNRVISKIKDIVGDIDELDDAGETEEKP